MYLCFYPTCMYIIWFRIVGVSCQLNCLVIKAVQFSSVRNTWEQLALEELTELHQKVNSVAYLKDVPLRRVVLPDKAFESSWLGVDAERYSTPLLLFQNELMDDLCGGKQHANKLGWTQNTTPIHCLCYSNQIPFIKNVWLFYCLLGSTTVIWLQQSETSLVENLNQH